MDEETSAGRVVGKEGLRALARLSEAPPRGSGPEGPCQWLAPGCMAHRDGGGRGRLFFFFFALTFSKEQATYFCYRFS